MGESWPTQAEADERGYPHSWSCPGGDDCGCWTADKSPDDDGE